MCPQTYFPGCSLGPDNGDACAHISLLMSTAVVTRLQRYRESAGRLVAARRRDYANGKALPLPFRESRARYCGRADAEEAARYRSVTTWSEGKQWRHTDVSGHCFLAVSIDRSSALSAPHHS